MLPDVIGRLAELRLHNDLIARGEDEPVDEKHRLAAKDAGGAHHLVVRQHGRRMRAAARDVDEVGRGGVGHLG